MSERQQLFAHVNTMGKEAVCLYVRGIQGALAIKAVEFVTRCMQAVFSLSGILNFVLLGAVEEQESDLRRC